MHGAPHTIVRVESGEALESVRELFIEYARSLDFDLRFQDFDSELDSLPGDYAPPSGALLAAFEGAKASGCVALRRIDESTCEMKRLYVRPEHRGRGVGRSLAERIIRIARAIGYRSMKLDTVSGMAEANALYRSLGFVDTIPYRFNPLDGCLFL
ncbi:MAG TPA: GNAT family N-acetyltransferase, partial [Candidatus Eisenbacteria bacterium]|nr:GNAT family N-acetyltransferase [Candidatus Eisenbacteria bacterium]